MKRAVNALQNFGKSLYGPVLILPIVGLFIAFGNVLGNGNLAEYLPFLGHPLIQSVGQLIAKSAVSVLVNLALVFAVGIPIGLATRDKGYAALIGLVTFIVFINAMNVTLQLQGELAPAEQMKAAGQSMVLGVQLSLIHISEPTRQAEISYAVFCLKKKKKKKKTEKNEKRDTITDRNTNEAEKGSQ